MALYYSLTGAMAVLSLIGTVFAGSIAFLMLRDREWAMGISLASVAACMLIATISAAVGVFNAG